ncbi:GAF domain-containing protein [Paraoerskovia marina]|uniref:GAF domain-containing protein n=1 Tax=Paraoerskovia marina TaxID=545619 RepID=UPI00138E48C0|nr:GAF domain-containing protein [Paraoerskovia marina]
MEQPGNPLVALWRFIGYHAATRKVGSTFAAGVLLAFGGHMLGTSIRIRVAGLDVTLNAPWWGATAVIVGVLVGVAALSWERQDDTLEVRTEARDRLLEQELAPLLDAAASTTGLARQDRIREAHAAAARAVASLCGAFDDVPGVRAIVFLVSDDGTRMTTAQSAGRSQRPGDFVRGTERGDKAFDVLLRERRRQVTVANLTDADPNEWAGSGDGYGTFISAPIRSGSEGFGLLTVDAEIPGTLDRSHASTVALFAAALAVLFAETARGRHAPGYDGSESREDD